MGTAKLAAIASVPWNGGEEHEWTANIWRQRDSVTRRWGYMVDLCPPFSEQPERQAWRFQLSEATETLEAWVREKGIVASWTSP